MGVGRRSVIRRVLYLRGRRPAARVHGPPGQTPALILAESLTLFLRSGTFSRVASRPQFSKRVRPEEEGLTLRLVSHASLRAPAVRVSNRVRPGGWPLRPPDPL